jgi:hypothetical protein
MRANVQDTELGLLGLNLIAAELPLNGHVMSLDLCIDLLTIWQLFGALPHPAGNSFEGVGLAVHDHDLSRHDREHPSQKDFILNSPIPFGTYLTTRD